MLDKTRVAIVGAGLGGLCLAHGLRRAGVDVTVFERDPALGARRQGYRLHIDARAGLALRRCLPPELFALFLETCGLASNRFTVMSEHLRVLHSVRSDLSRDPFDPATLSTSVNRQTLREILATDLEDRIQFGRELTEYAVGEEVTLNFADGVSVTADMLVGADGVNSVVRRTYLPQAEVVDTGGRCIYGKTLLNDTTLALIPGPMKEGFTAIVGGDIGMAAGLVQFRERPEAARLDNASAHLTAAGDYLMWAVSGRHDAFPALDATMAEMSAAGLHQLAQLTIKRWHPDLRALLAHAEIDDTFLVRVRTSKPIPPWTPSRVTLLGDAIHAMSPARGSGANTALQDAAVLCQALTEGGRGLTDAIGTYEQQMRSYGFAAVRASQDAETETGARRNRLMFWLYRRLARPL